ncbi:hypothetical protein B0920_05090 [Massilia sp. KIM]|uniref:T6SS phospholipase effector Tle1-like catalytic domain-containing protein n=1 Tax=Massilia sp. KIM TaxID=1955422 RepID=UPI00098FE3E1|nr:DUF2235 domain-containing protein [Massilia sp. KIM]OON62811.1 hypothetical protein B0920_05090 [Massilia sp. KIM]
MPIEESIEATAANRDLNEEPTGPFQDCRDVVHISVYFDGTGNNRNADEAKKSWSNVARIFYAGHQSPERGQYHIYIAGVGTAFNGDATGWLDSAGIWIEDGLPGLIAGAGGERRLIFGGVTVNRFLRDALLLNAIAHGGEVASYAKASGDKSFDELNRALGKHRLIKQINLSVFGFSRGAALARAFTNRILDLCEEDNGGLLYQGYPIRVNFLGLFDTVASFGLPSQNVQAPFRVKDLRVSTKVERCVHYVAGHEIRFSFPVDLIRLNGKLGGDWVERTYPGVHSDVGGGYEPLAQNIDNNYARIPMGDMMREARASGVRLFNDETLRKKSELLFAQRFECRSDTLAAYQGYMRIYGEASGPIEDQMKRHMRFLYAAYGTMHRRGLLNPGDLSRAASAWKRIGPKGMAAEVKKYRDALAHSAQLEAAAGTLGRSPVAAQAAGWVRIGGVATNSYAQYVKIPDWQLEAWDSNAQPGILEFVARFVHDSKVDFIANKEPFSYFKARGVDESTSSVWQDASAWIQTTAAGVSDTVQSTVAAGKAKAGEVADTLKTTVEDTAHEVAETVQEAAEAAKRRAVEARDYAAKKVDHAVGVARETAENIASGARRTADQVGQAAGNVYTAASQKARQAAHAAAERARAAKESADRMIESGTSWVRSTFNDWFGEGKTSD